ncbi:MAG: hypothetical protein R3F34_00510 [Planctomycetota bacterium]
MIARTTLALALIVPVAAFPLASAFAPTAQEREHEDEDEGNPQLHAFMEDLGRTLRTLGRAQKEKAEDTMSKGLAETVRLERALIDAKEQMPVAVSSMEDAKKRAKSELEYREQMQALMNGFFALENAYAAGDAGDVDKALRARRRQEGRPPPLQALTGGVRRPRRAGVPKPEGRSRARRAGSALQAFERGPRDLRRSARPSPVHREREVVGLAQPVVRTLHPRHGEVARRSTESSGSPRRRSSTISARVRLSNSPSDATSSRSFAATATSAPSSMRISALPTWFETRWRSW